MKRDGVTWPATVRRTASWDLQPEVEFTVLFEMIFIFCRPRLKPNGVSVLTRNSERLAEKSSLSLSNKNSQRSLSLLSSLHFRSGFIFSFIWLQGRKELTFCRVEFCRHFWWLFRNVIVGGKWLIFFFSVWAVLIFVDPPWWFYIFFYSCLKFQKL